MMNKNPEQALTDAREAVALMPNSVRAHLVLGRALAKTNHLDDAHAELSRALALALIEPAWYPIQMADARRDCGTSKAVPPEVLGSVTGKMSGRA